MFKNEKNKHHMQNYCEIVYENESDKSNQIEIKVIKNKNVEKTMTRVNTKATKRGI